MNLASHDYIQTLILRSKEHLKQEYNFTDLALSNYDTLNIFYVDSILSRKNSNLLITIPDKAFVNELIYPSILISVLSCMKGNYNQKDLYKIKRSVLNCETLETASVQVIKEGKIILWKTDKKTKRVVRVIENDLTKYIALRNSNAQKIPDLFKGYLSICSLLKEPKGKPPYRNRFKVVLVGSKNEIIPNIPTCIPFLYMNKSGQIYPDTPFDPLLIIVNDFATVREKIIEKGIKIETIIFIGDNKYLQSFSAISKNFRQEKFKHCIFIGTQDTETGENFEILKWNWTLPEMKYFTQQQNQKIAAETILHQELSTEILKYTNFIIETEKKNDNLINLKKVLKYIRKVYPITALCNDKRIRERANEIFEEFSVEVEEIFQDEYYNIDKSSVEDFQQLKTIYEKIIGLIKSNNLKGAWFKTAPNIDFIVVPKSIKHFWESEISNSFNAHKKKITTVDNLQKISNLLNRTNTEINLDYSGLKETKVITLKEFSEKEADGKSHLFLSLYSNGVYPAVLLQKILSSNMQTKILCYEEEAKALQFYQQSFLRNDELEYSSISREKLCGVEYPKTKNISNENIDEWLKYLIEFDSQKISRTEEFKYEIIFEDDTKTVERESKNVFVEDYEEQNKEVKHLKKGERVRIYHNPDKETLHDIIKMTDEELFSRVDYYSLLWKNALNEHYKKITTKYYDNLNALLDDPQFKIEEPLLEPLEQLFSELQANKLSVEKYRLESWMKIESKTKFPMKKRDLLAIIKTVDHPELNQNIQPIFALKSEYTGKMIKAGFAFSEEINFYILTKEKGKMLDWLSEKHIEEIIRTGAPTRTIKAIKKIDEELID